MKLTQEQAEALELGLHEEFYKNKLKKSGENALYHVLRKDYPSGKVAFWPIPEYVEKLKKELDQEKNIQQ